MNKGYSEDLRERLLEYIIEYAWVIIKMNIKNIRREIHDIFKAISIAL
jgi:hypothetical protein